MELDALKRTYNDLQQVVAGLQRQLAESEILRFGYGGTYSEACRRMEVYRKENEYLRSRVQKAETQLGGQK